MHRSCKGSVVLAALALLAVSTATKAQVTYAVVVDTTAITSTSGNIDIQFNPGAGALDALATVQHFAGDGSVFGSSTNTGGALGSLPGTVSIENSSGFNDLFQGFTFGSNFTFDVTFTGQALSPLAGTLGGSTFALSLYDATGTIPLVTTDPGGSVLDININPDGTTSVQNFPSNPNGGLPVATASLLGESVPEPGIFQLATVAICGIGFAFRRRQLRS